MGYNRLATFLVLPVAIPLVLGAVPGDVLADICQKKSLNNGCVNSADVENESLGLGKLKDEAGFDSEHSTLSNIALDLTDKNVAHVRLSAPRSGWAVATAAFEIGSSATPAKGSARCELTAHRPAFEVRKAVYDSVSDELGFPRASTTATMGFKIEKGRYFVNLLCRRLSGDGVFVAPAASLIVQYFPTRY